MIDDEREERLAEERLQAAADVREFMASAGYRALKAKITAKREAALSQIAGFNDTSTESVGKALCAAERMRCLDGIDRWLSEIIKEGRSTE